MMILEVEYAADVNPRKGVRGKPLVEASSTAIDFYGVLGSCWRIVRSGYSRDRLFGLMRIQVQTR